MSTKKNLFKIFMGISMLALAIMACNLGSGDVLPTATPGPGEAIPQTGSTQQSVVTQDAAVTPEPDITQPAAVELREIGGIDELVYNLTAVGATVELGGEINEPLLEKYDVEGQELNVNGKEVQVFIFGNSITRSIVSGRISDDGSSIAGQEIPWDDRPNFWAEGEIIVLYVGTDQATIDLVTKVMGEPITTHGS